MPICENWAGLTPMPNQSRPWRENDSMIPQELRLRHQWICWRYQLKNGALAKVPIDPRRRTFASSTNPETWTNYLAAHYAYKNNRRWLNGVSFAFTPNDLYYGVDIDNCIDKHGTLTDFAEYLVYQFNTYTEVSPSGNGVKMFCKANTIANLPQVFKGRNGWPVEIYSHSRFFTCTGNHLKETPLTVTTNSAFAAHFLDRALTERPDGTAISHYEQPEGVYDADETVMEVILAIINSRASSKFLRFQEGNWTGYPSESEADLALMNLLAFFTNNNIPLMMQVAYTTGLKRLKWERRYSSGIKSYLQHVAEVAINNNNA